MIDAPAPRTGAGFVCGGACVVDPRGAVAAGADCDHVDLGAEWHGSVGPVTFSA